MAFRVSTDAEYACGRGSGKTVLVAVKRLLWSERVMCAELLDDVQRNK
jgi:hypothetical protein